MLTQIQDEGASERSETYDRLGDRNLFNPCLPLEELFDILEWYTLPDQLYVLKEREREWKEYKSALKRYNSLQKLRSLLNDPSQPEDQKYDIGKIPDDPSLQEAYGGLLQIDLYNASSLALNSILEESSCQTGRARR